MTHPRYTLLRRDDFRRTVGHKIVIPAKGVAGVSCSTLHSRATALACKPVRALQGGIQRLCLTEGCSVLARCL
jgi:hypothetical protein